MQVALRTCTAANHGIACKIMWAGGQAVACSASPGVGTVYVSMTVDGQAAEARLPIAYASPTHRLAS